MQVSSDRESLCRRCGTCCRPAVPVGRLLVVLPGVRCRFLAVGGDGRTTCTVYTERFQVAPWCLGLDDARRGHMLASDCPYHGGIPDPAGKVVLKPAMLARISRPIAMAILDEGVEPWIDPEGVERFLSSAGYTVIGRENRLDGRIGFVVAPVD